MEGASEKAVSVLAEALESETETTRLRCAESILSKTFKAAELLDLQSRLEIVEKAMKEMQ